MVTDAWKNLWKAAADAQRWLIVSNALDILSEAYELQTAVPATAMLTSEGVYLEIELEDSSIMEFMDPDDIAELCPEAYAMLRRSGTVAWD